MVVTDAGDIISAESDVNIDHVDGSGMTRSLVPAP